MSKGEFYFNTRWFQLNTLYMYFLLPVMVHKFEIHRFFSKGAVNFTFLYLSFGFVFSLIFLDNAQMWSFICSFFNRSLTDHTYI